jgi:D-alanyl-lipoteichoic acid acyltransferase DltB (MBOAT superfamily)
VLFPTSTFTIFFLIVLPLSWILMARLKRWRLFMLLASYVFYAWWDWRFIFLLGVSTLVNQALGVAIHKEERPRWRKGLLAAAVAFNLGLLGYFKYYDFFITSAQNALTRLGLEISPSVVSITLPVGISFFTFQALSYVIDIYRRSFEPVGLGKFAVYLSFFPHLVAGPIVRASEFLPQLESRRDPRRVDASRAFMLILSGLFLKVVVANYLATHIVDDVFGTPEAHSSLEVLVAIYGYSVQIFADFCGYTNMAIGLALLLGFVFPQNFDSPYTAVSLQDFWRRWHMTLSRWLRDYLYIPLGGNRRGPSRTYVNLMLVMLLGGLWHGAAWTFVVWGGIHGVGLALERLVAQWRIRHGRPEPTDTRARRIVSRLVVFHVVCLAWVFFRADSFGTAREMLERLFVDWGTASPLVTAGVLVAIAFGIGVQYVPGRVLGSVTSGFSRLSPVLQAACLGLALVVTNAMGPQGVAPFIYYQF